jgi:hypothetical protein
MTTKESNMAGKRNEGLHDDYIRAPRGGYPDSQSPQAHRGSAQDFEQFGDRTVSMSDRVPGKTDDANPHAWDNVSSLHIEDENPE